VALSCLAETIETADEPTSCAKGIGPEKESRLLGETWVPGKYMSGIVVLQDSLPRFVSTIMLAFYRRAR
jgi:hypothetical protein